VSQPVRILGIAGSLRRGSYNRAALRAATQLVPEGTTLDIFDIDGIPAFNQDEEQKPPAKVVELKKAYTRGRCYSDCDAGIQLLYPGCVEKRD